jgi:hypothetical protein
VEAAEAGESMGHQVGRTDPFSLNVESRHLSKTRQAIHADGLRDTKERERSRPTSLPAR